MAKRSDFAQKLLDDLRLRKEQLAVAQSSGATLNSKARGSYAYSKQTFRGSTGHGKAAMTVDSTHFRSGGANRSFPREETSMQLVPFGRGQGSHQIGDLSMALALALENGGKLRQFDSSGRSSVLTFLPKMGRTGLQSQGNHGRNPSLSHLHIQEISKGAQKLNQILRACSNGLNFDNYSIEIGKELLKGAMDLQQALQMLVNLQEASESMVQPRSKSRIVLLEDDKEVKEEEEPVKGIEKKQLDLIPRFSFDKPTRPGRPRKQQRLPALVYPSESTFNSISALKRSTSYRTDQEKQTVSSSSNGKVGKGRMSNVIAKLMGLEEVPGNMDSNRSGTKIAGPKTKESVGPAVSSTKHYTTKPVKINPGTTGEVEESGASHGRRNAAVKFQEKPPWKKPESVKAMMAVDRTPIRQSKRHEEQCGTGETEVRLPSHEKVELKEKKARTEKKDKNRTGNELFTRSMETPKEKQVESEKRMARQKKGNEAISRPRAQRERAITDEPKLMRYLPDEAVFLKKSREFPEGRQGPGRGKITERDKIEIPRISRVKKAHGMEFQDMAKLLTRRSAAREAKQLNNGEAYMVSPTKVDTTEEVVSNAVKKLEGEGKVATPAADNLDSDPGRSVLLPFNINNDQHNTAGFDAEKELESAKLTLNRSHGTITDKVPQLDKENVPVPEIHEPLTEYETRLKHVLLKSRLFLNAAEALFKINTPTGIPKAKGQDYSLEDEDQKLALDCAFEILKRKGGRRELAVYPLARRARIGFPKISSFDDVVRQLYKSFEGLRAHGRKECHSSEVEDYLPRMLELDVCTRNPETDCMWDSGWEVPTFAMVEKDEVVKDVERLITSSLIDEMARDVLHM